MTKAHVMQAIVCVAVVAIALLVIRYMVVSLREREERRSLIHAMPIEAPVDTPGPAIIVRRTIEIVAKSDPDPESPPVFKRTYSAKVGDGFNVTIQMRTTMFGDRSGMLSEVTQRNGRWILFDPERVADKIIDRDLAPKVQAVADEALAMDKAFIKGKPAEFTDRTGVTWVRKP